MMKCILNAAFILLVTTGFALAQQPIPQGVLSETVQIPIVINGQTVGNATLPKGTPVKILQQNGDKSLIQATTGSIWINNNQITVVQPVSTPAPTPNLTVTHASEVPVAKETAKPSMVDEKYNKVNKYYPPVTKRLRVLIIGAYWDPNSFDWYQIRGGRFMPFIEALRDEGYHLTLIDYRDYKKVPNQKVTEADIDNNDIIFCNYSENLEILPAELFEKAIKNKNKLLIVETVLSPEVVHKYGKWPENRNKTFNMAMPLWESGKTGLQTEKNKHKDEATVFTFSTSLRSSTESSCSQIKGFAVNPIMKAIRDKEAEK